MGKISRSRRPARGSASLDRSALRALVKDVLGEMMSGGTIGVVRVPPGESTHFRIENGDVLVEVELVGQHGERVTARLGALMGGPSRGVWAVPDVETEVLVVFESGDFEKDAYIVGCIGGAPANLVPGTVVVIGTQVLLGDSNLGATDGVVHGSGIDPFTGSTYAALLNASTVVKAKK